MGCCTFQPHCSFREQRAVTGRNLVLSQSSSGKFVRLVFTVTREDGRTNRTTCRVDTVLGLCTENTLRQSSQPLLNPSELQPRKMCFRVMLGRRSSVVRVSFPSMRKDVQGHAHDHTATV